MTSIQEKKIEQIKNRALNLFGYAETKEIKSSEVYEISDGTISLVIEVGKIGDEGTMAELICRDHFHIFVGKKGGLSYISKNQKLRHADSITEALFKTLSH